MSNDERLAKISMYGEEGEALIRWLDEEGNESNVEMGRMIDLHSANIGKVLNGTYAGSMSEVFDKIRLAKIRYERQNAVPFVETVCTEKIFGVLNATALRGTMSMIIGSSRRGKTHAILEWMRKQKGKFIPIYIDVPDGGSATTLTYEIARKLGISPQGSRAQLLSRIYEKLTMKHVLIFDEIARVFGNNKPAQSLELIRRIHDVLGVPIVFCATNWFDTQLKNGQWSVYLEQLQGRLEDVLKIPAKVSNKELEAFFLPYIKGRPSKELMKVASDIVQSGDGGKIAHLVRCIQDAVKFAKYNNRSEIEPTDLLSAQSKRDGLNRWE